MRARLTGDGIFEIATNNKVMYVQVNINSSSSAPPKFLKHMPPNL
jgi:hypothetical protein